MQKLERGFRCEEELPNGSQFIMLNKYGNWCLDLMDGHREMEVCDHFWCSKLSCHVK